MNESGSTARPDGRPDYSTDDARVVVDCHAHVAPTSLLAQLSSGSGGYYGFSAVRNEQGWGVTVPSVAMPRQLRPAMADPASRENWIHQRGIDFQLLSPWMDLQPSAAMSAAAARDWSRRLNDAMLTEARESDTAIGALATLSVHDVDLAAADLAEATKENGLGGLLLSTNPPGPADLGDPALDQLWAAAAECGAPVMLHPPSDGPSRALPDSTLFGNVYCRLVDTTFGLTKLLLAGVLDRHPDLRLIAVHGGGFIPYQWSRLDGGYRADAPSAYSLDRERPSDYLHDIYYDTVAMSSAALRMLIDTVSAPQLLLGSDYPFPLADPEPVRTVRRAGLSHSETAAILGGNVLALFPRLSVNQLSPQASSPLHEGLGRMGPNPPARGHA